MAVCRQCGSSHYDILERRGGLCVACSTAKERGETLPSPANKPDASHIILTTESAHDLSIERRLDIVTAEVVIGMHLFKDVFAAFRDTFGGRSKVMQEGLREARRTALSELREEALALGADAVVGVDLDYSEISGGGKSMLFLVASGTAVTLRSSRGAMQ